MSRKAIRMLADFDEKGKPSPVKFKYEGEQKEMVIVKVDRILRRDENNYAGNKMYRYICETMQEGITVPYELRYELDTCRWFLYD